MLEKELCLFKKVWNKYICSSCYLSQPHLIQTGFVLSGTLDRESETAGRFFQPESQFRTGRWREHVFQNESISVWVLVLPSSDIYLMHDLELFFFFFYPSAIQFLHFQMTIQIRSLPQTVIRTRYDITSVKWLILNICSTKLSYSQRR